MRYILFLMLFLISGCAHNIYSTSKGWGVSISWNGNSYVPKVDAGYFDNTSLCVKDNVEIEYSTNTGASINGVSNSVLASLGKSVSGKDDGLLNGGTGAIQKIKIGPQTSGYVKEVLTCPNLSPNAIPIAKSIYGVKVDSLKGESSLNKGNVTVNATPKATKKEGGLFTPTETSIPVAKETENAINILSKSKTIGLPVLCMAIVLIAVVILLFKLFKTKTK